MGECMIPVRERAKYHVEHFELDEKNFSNPTFKTKKKRGKTTLVFGRVYQSSYYYNKSTHKSTSENYYWYLYGGTSSCVKKLYYSATGTNASEKWNTSAAISDVLEITDESVTVKISGSTYANTSASNEALGTIDIYLVDIYG